MGLMLRRMCMMGASAIPTPPLIKTVSGALIHITDALAKPLKKLVVNLEPVQAGTGDPAPDNVRPSTGWTGCKTEHTGINVWKQSFPYDLKQTYAGWYIPYQQTITVKLFDKNNGADVSGIYFGVSADCTAGGAGWVLQNGAITQSTTNNAFQWRRADRHYVTLYPGNETTLNKLLARYDVLVLADADSSAYDAPYTPYQGTTIPYTFPTEAGTVYGGTLTINEDGSGVLVSNYIGGSPNQLGFTIISSRMLSQDGTVILFVLAGRNYKFCYSPLASSSLCNKLKYSTSADANSFQLFYVLNNEARNLYIRLPYTEELYNMTNEEVLDYIESLGLSIVYVPSKRVDKVTSIDSQTFTLTSQQVLTLLQGENNVWSDAQSIEITYVASANSDDLNAADSLNLLLGNAYTRGDVPDEEALQIILGETT